MKMLKMLKNELIDLSYLKITPKNYLSGNQMIIMNLSFKKLMKLKIEISGNGFTVLINYIK